MLLWAAFLCFAILYPIAKGMHKGTFFLMVLLMWLPCADALALLIFTCVFMKRLGRIKRIVGFLPAALFVMPVLLLMLLG